MRSLMVAFTRWLAVAGLFIGALAAAEGAPWFYPAVCAASSAWFAWLSTRVRRAAKAAVRPGSGPDYAPGASDD